RKDLALTHHDPGVTRPQQPLPHRLRRPRRPTPRRRVLLPQVRGQPRQADPLQQPVRTIDDHRRLLPDHTDPTPTIPAPMPRTPEVLQPTPLRHPRRPGAQPLPPPPPPPLTIDPPPPASSPLTARRNRAALTRRAVSRLALFAIVTITRANVISASVPPSVNRNDPDCDRALAPVSCTTSIRSSRSRGSRTARSKS